MITIIPLSGSRQARDMVRVNWTVTERLTCCDILARCISHPQQEFEGIAAIAGVIHNRRVKKLDGVRRVS